MRKALSLSLILGAYETLAAYNAEEEVDPDGDTEDAAPVEVPPLPSGGEELIDEGSGMPYYFNWSTNETTWDRPVEDPLLDR